MLTDLNHLIAKMLAERPSQARPVGCGHKNVSCGVGNLDEGMSMSRREQTLKAFDAGEASFRREQRMGEIRMMSSFDNLPAFFYPESIPFHTTQLADFDEMAELDAEMDAEIWSRPKGVRIFFHFLMRDDGFLDFKYEADRTLMKIFYGACGETSETSVREAVPCFVRLLDSPHDNVCELAVFILGFFARDSLKFRNLVLSNGVLVPLVKKLEKHANLEKQAKLSILRNITWTLSCLCADITVRNYEQLKPSLKTLERLLHSDDIEVLINLCWVVKGLSYGGYGICKDLVDARLCPILVKHIIHSIPLVQFPVLMTVDRIASLNTNIQGVIENGEVLEHLLTLLTEDSKDENKDRCIKKLACGVMSGILRGNVCQIQAVIDAKLLFHLGLLLGSPLNDVQYMAVVAISEATSHASSIQIEYLVKECGILKYISNPICSTDLFLVQCGLEILQNVLSSGKKIIGGRNYELYRKLIMKEDQCLEVMEKIRMQQGGYSYELSNDASYVLYLLGLNDDFDSFSDIDEHESCCDAEFIYELV